MGPSNSCCCSAASWPKVTEEACGEVRIGKEVPVGRMQRHSGGFLRKFTFCLKHSHNKEGFFNVTIV